MKILSKHFKVTLFVAVTVLFAFTLLLMNSSKVYCASDTLQSVANLSNKGFFSDVGSGVIEYSKYIFDSDNGYKMENLEAAEWKYPDEDKTKKMKYRNLESFYLYARDSSNSEIKLNPIDYQTYWTNYNAENYAYIRFKQKMPLPDNVELNNDAMTLNSYKLNDYYKTSSDSTKVDKGIILYRSSARSEFLWNAGWKSLRLADDECIYIEAPAYVEIAILYELREKKGRSSYYSHCVARYCLWVTTR